MESNLVVVNKGNGGAGPEEHGLVVFNSGPGLDESPEVIQAGNSAGPAEEEEPGEEWFEAKSLLHDPRLLDIFLEDIERAGCVGDEENKSLMFLTFVSRFLDDPLSLIVKGESSSGKNFEVDNVLKFFPDDQILAFSRITAKALYYMEGQALAHKILIIYERPGAEDADYSIRTLLSEKGLTLFTVEKDEKTGKNVGKKRTINGPVSYVETTTSIKTNNENENRSFSLNVDDSEIQTERIVNAQKKKYMGILLPIGKASNIYGRWKMAQKLLWSYPVIMPFVNYIKFPTHRVRTRRDHKKFLTLIETIAFLHQYQREKKVVGGVEHIIADVYDYKIAYGLAHKIIGQIFKRISEKGEHLVKLVSENHLEVDFNRKMLEELTGWDKETIRRYISEAVEKGYFEVVEAGTRGRSFSYKLAKSISEMPAGTLISPEDLRQKMAAEKGDKGD